MSAMCLARGNPNRPYYQAVTYEWLSPLHQYVDAHPSRRLAIEKAPTLIAKVDDEPKQLAHAAALKAFWDIYKEPRI